MVACPTARSGRVRRQPARRHQTWIPPTSGLEAGCPPHSTSAQSDSSPQNPERFNNEPLRVYRRLVSVSFAVTGVKDPAGALGTASATPARATVRALFARSAAQSEDFRRRCACHLSPSMPAGCGLMTDRGQAPILISMGIGAYRALHRVQHIVIDLFQQSPDFRWVRKNLGARYAACTDQFSPRMSAAMLLAMRAADSCTESRARCA